MTAEEKENLKFSYLKDHHYVQYKPRHPISTAIVEATFETNEAFSGDFW